MACTSQILSGLAQDCETSKGGIKKVWITTENPWPIVNPDTGIIDMFYGKGFIWLEYNFKKNTSSMTSTFNIDPANGVNFVTTEVILQFNRMTTEKQIEMSILALEDLYIVVLDSNNKYWFIGLDEPCNATAGTAQTGTAKTDGNFYQITLSNDSQTLPYEVDPAALPFTHRMF